MMALSFLASRVLTSPSTDRRLSLFWVIGLLWLRRMQPPTIYATAQHITSHVVIATKQTLHIEYHQRTTWMSIYASTEYRRLHFCVSVIYSFIEAVSDTVTSILIYSRYKTQFSQVSVQCYGNPSLLLHRNERGRQQAGGANRMHWLADYQSSVSTSI